MEQTTPATIDAYIAGCRLEVQPALKQLRRTIAEAAPRAAEKISWGMATFALHGNLVHFSAAQNHIGFHPAPTAIDAFRAELAGYVCSKGTVRLPYDAPLPLDLIRRMVAFRVAEQERLAAVRQAKKRPHPRQPPGNTPR